MKKVIALLSTSLLVAYLGACSSDGGDDDGASSSGGSSSSSSSGGAVADGGGSSGSGSGGNGSSSSSGGSNATACKGKTSSAPAINPKVVAAAAPTATGGTIASGTYNLTSVNVYNGNPAIEGASIKITLTIDGLNYVRAYSISGMGQTFEGSDSGTYTTTTGQIVATQQCEDGDEDNGFGGFGGAFSVVGNELKVYDEVPLNLPGDTIEYIATKQ